MILFHITGSESIDNYNLNGDECVRRILCYSSLASVSFLLYQQNTIATFSSENNIDIDFKSYYGFPKISDFSILSAPNSTITVLVDTVPASSITDNYITLREV